MVQIRGRITDKSLLLQSFQITNAEPSLTTIVSVLMGWRKGCDTTGKLLLSMKPKGANLTQRSVVDTWLKNFHPISISVILNHILMCSASHSVTPWRTFWAMVVADQDQLPVQFEKTSWCEMSLLKILSFIFQKDIIINGLSCFASDAVISILDTYD